MYDVIGGLSSQYASQKQPVLLNPHLDSHRRPSFQLLDGVRETIVAILAMQLRHRANMRGDVQVESDWTKLFVDPFVDDDVNGLDFSPLEYSAAIWRRSSKRGPISS